MTHAELIRQLEAEGHKENTHRLAVTFTGGEAAIMKAWRELRAFMQKTGVNLKEVCRERIEDGGE